MKQRHLTGLLVAVSLLVSLLSGTIVSGAQSAPDLTKAFTWQPYGLTVHYPADWAITEKGQAVSLHPAARNVSDGLGPELVLFEVPITAPGMLDGVIESFTNAYGGQHDAVISGSLGGYATQSTQLTWDSTGAVGGLLLVAASDDQALGAAYIVRRSESAIFMPILQAITASLSFDSTAGARTTGTSFSVTSVQLPQPFNWDAVGLSLYFPADWQVVESASNAADAGRLLTARPADGLPFRLIQAMTLEGYSNLNLQQLAQLVTGAYQTIGDPADVTVAGYPAVLVDLIDESGTPTLVMRTLAVDMVDQNTLVLFMLSADQSVWDAFRPLASAFLSSVERTGAQTAFVPAGGTLSPVARALPGSLDTRRQDGPTTTPYDWVTFGIAFNLPEGWADIHDGQNFDLALVSPEAIAAGQGAYLTMRIFSTLGQDTTIESALQSLADQSGGTLAPFTAAERDGMAVTFTDDSNSTDNMLILLPYGEGESVMYIQTVAPSGGNEVITTILDSMTVDPPQPDYAAADAAWQASLAADGTLTYGSADAPVQMIEYLSFTCSHCADYTLQMEHLTALEVEQGRLRIEWAPLAGDTFAELATHATYCAAEQGKGFSTYEALYGGFISQGYDVAYTPEGLTALLEPLGVDMGALQTCIDAKTYQASIDKVRQDFVDNGLTGTPTLMLAKNGDAFETLLFPDGTVWSGVVPIDILTTVLDSIISDGLSIADAMTAYFGS